MGICCIICKLWANAHFFQNLLGYLYKKKNYILKNKKHLSTPIMDVYVVFVGYIIKINFSYKSGIKTLKKYILLMNALKATVNITKKKKKKGHSISFLE